MFAVEHQLPSGGNRRTVWQLDGVMDVETSAMADIKDNIVRFTLGQLLYYYAKQDNRDTLFADIY